MVTPSSSILIPSFGASQRKSRFQCRDWVPTVDQVEWRIYSYAILCRIDGERQPLCVLVPILLIRICNVHLQSPRQGLHHSFCCSIRLGSIYHGCKLFLLRDPIERSKEIGHEPWLSIVTDRFTGPESSKHTFLVTLSDRLCSSGVTRFRDHVP